MRFSAVGVRIRSTWTPIAKLTAYRINMVRGRKTFATAGAISKSSAFTVTQKGALSASAAIGQRGLWAASSRQPKVHTDGAKPPPPMACQRLRPNDNAFHREGHSAAKHCAVLLALAVRRGTTATVMARHPAGSVPVLASVSRQRQPQLAGYKPTAEHAPGRRVE